MDWLQTEIIGMSLQAPRRGEDIWGQHSELPVVTAHNIHTYVCVAVLEEWGFLMTELKQTSYYYNHSSVY